MYDLILSGGLVYDGLGNSPAHNDIGIIGDRIVRIGNLGKESCRKRIDIKNLSISPGFIDMHSHSDAYYFIHPSAECKIRQGVTTEVIGNCGGSAAPLYGEFRFARKKEWEPLGIRIRWNTFKEYADILKDSGVSVNVVPLVGHGNIRGAVKGYSTSPVTKKEMQKMKRLLVKAMEEGAVGLSTGLIYTPGMYADTGEIIELVKIVKEYNGIYTTHIRGEGNTLIEAIEEAIRIAEETGATLQISHLKTGSRRNWGKIQDVFNLIESAIKRGIDVTCDRYPYIASNTDLDVLLPRWFHEMPYKARKECINKCQDELVRVLKMVKGIMVGRVENRTNKWAEGLFLTQIARRLRINPEQAIIKLLKDADFQVQAMFFTMCEGNLKRILKKPYVMIGSDSSLRALKGPLRMGHPHPRTFGTFPRVLARYTQPLRAGAGYTGRGMLSMREAIYKMTGMPANKLGLKDRGRLSEGVYADIVVFNPDKIRDMATYEEPFQYPKGIEFVIVNGQIVLDKGIMTGRLPGKICFGKIDS